MLRNLTPFLNLIIIYKYLAHGSIIKDMRIWDIPPDKLCRNHLLGEHNELHAMWNILTQGKKGYANHPETKKMERQAEGIIQSS